MQLDRSRIPRVLCLILLALSLFGCDHATKFAAKASLEGAAAVPVAPSVLRGALELRYVENTDVAFNALERLGVPRSPALLIALSSIAIGGILVMGILAWRRRSRVGDAGDGHDADGHDADGHDADARPIDGLTRAGLAMILGGAFGNVVDRIARGCVIDFIHVKGWPVFNVADIAVVVGVGLLAVSRVRRSPRVASPP